MQDDTEKDVRYIPLAFKHQALAVAGFAALAGAAMFFLLLSPGNGQPSGAEPRKPAYFLPDKEQAGAMRLETVLRRSFHTETIADGYVAANGSWGAAAPGTPVLAGQSADILQAENDLVTGRAQLRNATANEERQRKLYQTDGAALKDWQQAQADLTAAAAAFETARNKLRLLGKSDQEIRGILQAAPKTASGQGQVFTVGNSSLVWLVANIREADVRHIHKGDQAEARFSAFPERIFRVPITYLSDTIDPVTHRFVAAGPWRNTDGALKPNMQAMLVIAERDDAQAPAVRESAIAYEGDQKHVWVVDPSGRYFLRQISTGRTQDGYVEVLHGVAAGERVVTEGALFVDQAKAAN